MPQSQIEIITAAKALCTKAQDLVANLEIDHTFCDHQDLSDSGCDLDTSDLETNLNLLEKEIEKLAPDQHGAFITNINSLTAARIAQALNTLHSRANLHLALHALEALA